MGQETKSKAVVFSPNATMTGTAVLTGNRQDVGQLRGCSFQTKWTGTAVGTFSFEVSNDVDPDGTVEAAVCGWTALTLPSGFAAGNPAGTASNFVFEFDPIAWRWIRPKYTNTSSTGVLLMMFEGKGNA